VHRGLAVTGVANITGFGGPQVWLSAAFVLLQLDLRNKRFFRPLKSTIPIIINRLSKQVGYMATAPRSLKRGDRSKMSDFRVPEPICDVLPVR